MHPETREGESESSALVELPAPSLPSAGFAEEKAELDWVLSHPEINRSTNLVHFLAFICNKHFEGDSDNLHEPTIAVEALGRKQADYDSRIDPIVRVTARTLRKKLQKLYETEGKSHRIRIVLPVGHYVPQFVRNTQTRTEGAAFEAAEPLDAIPENAAFPDALPLAALPVENAGNWANKMRSEAARLWRKLWKPAAALAAFAAVFVVGFYLGGAKNQPGRPDTNAFKWDNPVWSDEFEGPALSLPDASKWAFDTNDSDIAGAPIREVLCSPSTGNKECDLHHPNVFQDGMGHLVLRAQKNGNGVWTLARINTKGLKNFQYGRIEARMKLPVGKGLWPSFILSGADTDTVRWPASGSVDIMENVAIDASSNGLGPNTIRSTLHGPRYSGANGMWHDFKLPNGERVDDGSFHTYGIIWSPSMVQFYFDDPANIYAVHDTSDVPEGGSWVFDKPFYIQIALSIGGDWAGEPDATTPNPADLLIDYVRVYKNPTIPAPKIDWKPIEVRAGSSSASTVSLRSAIYAGRVHVTCSTDSQAIPCSLATSILNFSDTTSQQDTLTIATDSFTDKGRTVALPGRYEVTITATTISGDQSQLKVPFDVIAGT